MSTVVRELVTVVTVVMSAVVRELVTVVTDCCHVSCGEGVRYSHN